MEIQHHISLKNYNTFGIDVKARSFISVTTVAELQQVLREHSNEKLFILGGGSNMLLTRDIDALVVHVNLRGREITTTSEDYAVVKAMAGENWHEFVLYTIENDLGGLENMSLIPGNVGTTPIQNIGAYGAEIKDTMVSCNAVHIKTGAIRTFTNEECRFGYRESIFKSAEKDQYVIVAVTFRLTRRHHKINIGYGDIKKELEKAGVDIPTIKDVSNAVIAIRQSKLPDPKVLGNSGSFFKNPIVPVAVYEQARKKFPEMPNYPIDENYVKVPAGWLIEQAGFKGYRAGDAGVHDRQALVLVNHGAASGAELLALSQKIQHTVFEKYGIRIEAEVNVV